MFSYAFTCKSVPFSSKRNHHIMKLFVKPCQFRLVFGNGQISIDIKLHLSQCSHVKEALLYETCTSHITMLHPFSVCKRVFPIPFSSFSMKYPNIQRTAYGMHFIHICWTGFNGMLLVPNGASML